MPLYSNCPVEGLPISVAFSLAALNAAPKEEGVFSFGAAGFGAGVVCFAGTSILGSSVGFGVSAGFVCLGSLTPIASPAFFIASAAAGAPGTLSLIHLPTFLPVSVLEAAPRSSEAVAPIDAPVAIGPANRPRPLATFEIPLVDATGAAFATLGALLTVLQSFCLTAL